MKRKNKERKRRERYERKGKAKKNTEPVKTTKEKNQLSSSTETSDANEKDKEYDSDLSSECDEGPARGFYNQIVNMRWKKEVTANKIRILREAKRYDHMLNYLMREVQRLNALVRSLMQRQDNTNLETRRQKAAKNEQREEQMLQRVQTNTGIQTDEITKVDMASQVTEEKPASLSEERSSIRETEQSEASQNSTSSSEDENLHLRIIERGRNNPHEIRMLPPANEPSNNHQGEERRMEAESRSTQTNPITHNKFKVVAFLISLIAHVAAYIPWPQLPELPYNPLYVVLGTAIVMMTALYYC